jgi:hypothetical protein
VVGETVDEPLGGGADAEGDRLDRLQGRLEGDLLLELGGRGTGREQLAVPP